MLSNFRYEGQRALTIQKLYFQNANETRCKGRRSFDKNRAEIARDREFRGFGLMR